MKKLLILGLCLVSSIVLAQKAPVNFSSTTGSGIQTGSAASLSSLLVTGTTAPTLVNGNGSVYASATNGGIFSGAGSTNDLILANKTGATVCSVATGGNSIVCVNQLSAARLGVTAASLPANGFNLPATNTVGAVTNSILHWSWNAAGQPASIGTVPGTPSSCGTGSPTVAGTDAAGTITTGTGATGCTMAFAATWVITPHCVFTTNSGSITVGLTSKSTTSITLTFSAAFSGTVDYVCVGA